MAHVPDPEYFDRPAPKGRSRESGIVLDELGRFWHDGARVEHGRMALSFARWIDRHPRNGRYILNNGYDWSYFTVRATPFFVLSVEMRPEHSNEPPAEGTASHVPRLGLSDGSFEVLNPNELWLEADVLHTTVKAGAFKARFSPTAQLELGAVCAEQNGRFVLELCGTSYVIRR